MLTVLSLPACLQEEELGWKGVVKMGAAKVVFAIISISFAILVYFIVKPRTFEPIKPLKDKWWGKGERLEESADIIPFQLKFDEGLNEDLKRRLKSTRYFDALEDSRWVYGTRTEFMKTVVEFWIDKFSWKDQVDYINKLSHFKTSIDGISLHFVHMKPKNVKSDTKVLPIILLHGWPGSFFEFHKAIPMLLEEKNGIAFELVIPSLPGYGYSSAAQKTGMGPGYMALIMKKLMNRLGFQKFYVQGGDWGSEVGRNLAKLYPSAVKGLHLNFWVQFTNPKYPILTHVIGAIAPSLVLPDPEERQKIFPFLNQLVMLWNFSGYLHIQATKPDTVAFGLNDSPAGLASYLLEKFVTAFGGRKCDFKDVFKCLENKVTLEDLLTEIMIYWETGSMPSAVRLYREGTHSENQDIRWHPVKVPTGFAAFPYEIFPPPKSWLENACNLVSYTKMDRGGHFAAWEEPKAFTDDVRKFVGIVESL